MLTFGHGRLTRAELGALVTSASVTSIVDVRRFPGSRANPAAAQGEVADLAAEIGIAYRHDERLGGRRRLTADEDASSPDSWWRVAQFRAYAAWTRSPEFRAGLAQLVSDNEGAPDGGHVAIMCSEAVWWRCHRRIVADVAQIEHGIAVGHLMHDGSVKEHIPSEAARPGPGGFLEWPA
ncbi:MAG: DUF488 domain-containing protein [Actinomycetota bacterium]|nr:DUF488 domain-containing protein [Actinomycetota bacterium]